MEEILGVKQALSKNRQHDDWVSTRQDLIEADEVDDLMGDGTRTRYQRLFWEPSVEDDVRYPFFHVFCRNLPIHLLMTVWRFVESRHGGYPGEIAT